MYSKIRNVIVVMLMATSTAWAAGAAAEDEVVGCYLGNFRVLSLKNLALQNIAVPEGSTLENVLKAGRVPQDLIAEILPIPKEVSENPAILTRGMVLFEDMLKEFKTPDGLQKTYFRPRLQIHDQKTKAAMETWLRGVLTRGLICENDSQRALLGVIVYRDIQSAINQPIVALPLIQCAEVNTEIRDSRKYTLLSHAVQYVDQAIHMPIIDALIKAGANKETRNDLGYTPLALAALHGRGPATKALIKAGANLETMIDSLGDTPLCLACRKLDGNYGIAWDLLRAGANPNVSTSEGDTPLLLTSDPAVSWALILKGANPNAQNAIGVTPLMRAGTKIVIDKLIGKGADIDARDHNGNTPLILAVCDYRKDAVRALIGHRPDIHAINHAGRTALAIAEERGYKDIAAMLRAAGAQ